VRPSHVLQLSSAAMARGLLWHAASWLCFGLKIAVLLYISSAMGLCSSWDFLWEPMTKCERISDLPANASGIKVLVYAPAKSGTKSISKALVRMGYRHTYHSEDILYSVWTRFADEFWGRPENGGVRFGTVWPPASKGWHDKPTTSDLTVLKNSRPEDLASAFRNCGVDVAVMDGIEEIFWPLYNVSPDAKVISLNWRTWDEYSTSWAKFSSDLTAGLTLLQFVVCSSYLLPWSVIMIPIIELLSGNEIHRYLSTGGPPVTAGGDGFAVRFFWYQTFWRRWLTHTRSGLERRFSGEQDYVDYFADARRRIPAERLFEWDMRRHTMADLCGFLGTTDHPACATPGRLPKGVNVLYIEREGIYVTCALLALFLLLHWANYRIMSWVCGRCCCCRRSAVGQQRDRHKLE